MHYCGLFHKTERNAKQKFHLSKKYEQSLPSLFASAWTNGFKDSPARKATDVASVCRRAFECSSGFSTVCVSFDEGVQGWVLVSLDFEETFELFVVDLYL